MQWEAFRELFQASVNGSYHETLKDWQGYMLMAIDTSHIAVLQYPALRE